MYTKQELQAMTDDELELTVSWLRQSEFGSEDYERARLEQGQRQIKARGKVAQEQDWYEIGRQIALLDDMARIHEAVWTFGSGEGTGHRFAGVAALPGMGQPLEQAGDDAADVLQRMVYGMQQSLPLQPVYDYALYIDLAQPDEDWAGITIWSGTGELHGRGAVTVWQRRITS